MISTESRAVKTLTATFYGAFFAAAFPSKAYLSITAYYKLIMCKPGPK